MIRKNIEQILKQGSMRQKTLLYMNDLAIFNTTLDTEKRLLTDKERTIIYRGLKTPQDIKHYNNMRTSNKGFLFFNDIARTTLERVIGFKQALLQQVLNVGYNRLYRDIINDLLDLYPEEDSREKALALALDKSEIFKTYHEKGYSPYVVEDESHKDRQKIKRDVEGIVNSLEIETEGLKIIHHRLKQITKDDLPVKPYRDEVEKREERCRAGLQEAITMIDFINEELGYSLKITPYDEIGLPEAYSANSVNNESALLYE